MSSAVAHRDPRTCETSGNRARTQTLLSDIPAPLVLPCAVKKVIARQMVTTTLSE